MMNLANKSTKLSINTYRLLGKSGLYVSPLCLGTMLFGTDWPGGIPFDESKQIFDEYISMGGNFIDTANVYTNGSSERFVGELVGGMRSTTVVATKYSVRPKTGQQVEIGGNSRKSLVENLNASLQRMQIGYIDLFYVHVWDMRTPLEEVMRALDDVVRSGKALYVGVSNTPAWVVSRSNLIADFRGWSPFIALQTHYNLLERSLEGNLLPMARALDIGVVPWGALATGFLAGKYTPENINSQTGRRSDFIKQEAIPRNWATVDAVHRVATEVNRSPAQVCLNWVLQRQGITSSLIGVSNVQQLHENASALSFSLTADQISCLEQNQPTLEFPYDYLQHDITAANISIAKRFQI